MAEFKVVCRQLNSDSAEERIFFYDNEGGFLTDAHGVAVGDMPDRVQYVPAPKPNGLADAPITKTSTPKILKIQMGLSCNFECSYCLQKYVPHTEDPSARLVPSLVEKIKEYITEPPDNIQLWGGEPFVYIKTMRPLVAAIKEFWPAVTFSIITNGSLLTQENIDWMLANNIFLSISHDGPGQPTRGPDPFEDPVAFARIKDFYWEMKKRNAISVNPMIYKQNQNRAEVAKYLADLFGDPDIHLGEGGFIELYDAQHKDNALHTKQEHFDYRRLSFSNSRAGADRNFSIVGQRLDQWMRAMRGGRVLDSLEMKCGMDSPNSLTIDMDGNVVTCQNVTATSTAMNGAPHKGGHVSDLAGVKIETSTHFYNRPHCTKCPVVQNCRGNCMFLQDDLFYGTCNTSFSDHITTWALAIEKLTGWTPMFIDADWLPPERQDIWGFFLEHKEKATDKLSAIEVVTE